MHYVRGQASLVLFLAATGLSVALKSINTVLTARVSAPSDLGSFQALMLICAYSSILQMGIFNGLAREFPYLIGRGDSREARGLVNASASVAFSISAVMLIGLLAVAASHALDNRPRLAAIWALHAFGVAASFYATQFLIVLYKTSHEFVRVASIALAVALVTLFLLPLPAHSGVLGHVTRFAVVSILQLGLLLWMSPVKPVLQFKRIRLAKLLAVGAPIFVVGQLFALWPVLDSTLVLRLLGKEQLGVYAIVVGAFQAAQVLPMAAAQVYYPKFAAAYGGGRSGLELLRSAWRVFGLVQAASLVVGLCLAASIPVLVSTWLPAYSASIRAAQWAAVNGALQSILVVTALFNVFGRQRAYLVTIATGIAVYGAAVWMFSMLSGTSLESFQVSLFMGQLAFIGSVVVILWVHRPSANSPTRTVGASPAA
jgi:O-antigen/teichoic acid export membrane protein